jgi:hypothetical protein
MIYPFLQIKRAQAATALHLASIWESGAKDRYSLCRQLQHLMFILNRTGPEFVLPAEEDWLFVPSLLAETQPPKFSTTWPQSGCLRNGIAYRLPPLVLLTAEIVSGLLPTPSATPYGTTNNGCPHDGRTEYATKGTPSLGTLARAGLLQTWPTPRASDGGKDRPSSAGWGLRNAVRTWPTPAARDYRFPNAEPYSQRGGGTKGEQLPNAVGGALTPEFCEWLMGFPIGFTELPPSAIRSSRRSSKSSGGPS